MHLRPPARNAHTHTQHTHKQPGRTLRPVVVHSYLIDACSIASELIIYSIYKYNVYTIHTSAQTKKNRPHYPRKNTRIACDDAARLPAPHQYASECITRRAQQRRALSRILLVIHTHTTYYTISLYQSFAHTHAPMLFRDGVKCLFLWPYCFACAMRRRKRRTGIAI